MKCSLGGLMNSLKFDLLQLLILGVPALLAWKQGLFQLSVERPESSDGTADFKPYFILLFLATVHITLVWLEARVL